MNIIQSTCVVDMASSCCCALALRFEALLGSFSRAPSGASKQLHFKRRASHITSCQSDSSSSRGYEPNSEQGHRCWDLGARIGEASFAALAVAILCYADPALAFKGGGPYGSEVTRGQDLSGKDFTGRTLTMQDFKTSILRQAKFKGAKLFGASFFDANLTGADFSDADLRGADFSLADATKANFTNANLEGALVTGNTSFKGANITGADFTDVLWREDQRVYLCKIADGVNPFTGNATRETLLCE